MPDRKPARFVADERETLLGMLQYQRDSLVRKVDDLDDTLVDAIGDYRATSTRTDQIVRAAPSLDERCQRIDGDGEPVSLRWVLAHLLQETARHAGHADILRELIDGQTGR